MNEYLIAIGSNMGDRLDLIRQAARLIEARCGKIHGRSPLYATDPIGSADKPFLNGALVLASMLDPHSLLKVLLEIEMSLGRERSVHWGNRTMDLDIILARDGVGQPIQIDLEILQIPHARMLERDFVLVPSGDVAAEWIHPLSHKSLSNEIRDRFSNGLKPLANFTF